MTPHAEPLHVIDTGLAPARWNVALTAALAESHATGGLADTVRFHRYPTSVLLGAGQNADAAADIAHCRQANVEIARRVTGGGAVYMSPGMLAWDVLVDRTSHGGRLEAVTAAVCGGIAAGLSALGVTARFRAPNDIEIGGRKVSGSSGYAFGPSAVLQGTVLMRDDIPAMARVLCISEADLRKRVTCLECESGTVPALARLVSGIVTGLADALERVPVPGAIAGSVRVLCEALLRDEIGTDAYVFGHTFGSD